MTPSRPGDADRASSVGPGTWLRAGRAGDRRELRRGRREGIRLPAAFGVLLTAGLGVAALLPGRAPAAPADPGPPADVGARAPIRDLGTLGGDWSQALGVSPDGRRVVGASQVAPGRLHSTSAHAFLWRDGRMRDLGTLGGTESEARDVNDVGQVVGVAEADSGRGLRLDPRRFPGRRRFVDVRRRAFLWEDGRMRDLGTLGGRSSEAHAVNARGWVVGRSQVPPGRLHSTSAHAFLWRDGRMEDLGTLGGTESVALDVADAGHVVGASQTAPAERTRRVEVHAFLWRDGRMRDLGTLGGDESRARAVDDRGRVVGTSTTEEGHARAFLWEDGRMRDLGTLGGRSSRGWDLDARGRVVGASTTADGEVHAFLWVDGRMEDLGTLDGDSRAYAVSGEGLAAGASRTERTREGRVSIHAVIWRFDGSGR